MKNFARVPSFNTNYSCMYVYIFLPFHVCVWNMTRIFLWIIYEGEGLWIWIPCDLVHNPVFITSPRKYSVQPSWHKDRYTLFVCHTRTRNNHWIDVSSFAGHISFAPICLILCRRENWIHFLEFFVTNAVYTQTCAHLQ